MSRSRFGSPALVVAACAAAGGCHDGLLYDAAPAGPASLSLAVAAHGGSPEAYARVDQLLIRFRAGTEIRLEEVRPFDPAGTETRVRINVPLRDLTETLTVELELRMTEQPLFRSSAQATLTAGLTTSVAIPEPDPVIASVVCGGPQVEFTAFGQTAQLAGAALFASNDTVRTAALQWSTAQTSVVSVAANTGIVTAVQDGTAQVVCAGGGFTDTRPVRVFAAVAAITVGPPAVSIPVGAQQQFTVTLQDARANIIPGRSVTWTSSSAAATISPAGLATGQTPGTSRIDATTGGVTGSASLTVLPPPVVATTDVSGVTETAATLHGTVDPLGVAATAWFEYSTDATLATFTSTPAQSVGSGPGAVAVTASVAKLSPGTNYYFRAAASSASGTARGQILKFTTLIPPPLVTTTPPTTVRHTSAVLNGTIDPRGFATTAWFDYSTRPDMIGAVRVAQQSVGSAAVGLIHQVNFLTAGTTYYYRIGASNGGGTTLGNVVSFRTQTPAAPVGRMISAVWNGSSFEIVLRGGITTNGVATEAWFEWSNTPDFRTITSTSRVSLAAGDNEVEITARPTMPSCNVVYVRVVGQNAFGISFSPAVNMGQPPPCIIR